MKTSAALHRPFIDLAVLALPLAFAACSGEGDDPIAPPTDVYVAGQEWLTNSDGRATLWKNGIAQRLSDDVNSRAYSVFASGDDTYVFGAEQATALRYILWKNGVRQELDYDSDFRFTFNGYFVSGNDVYVAGQGGAKHVPTIWKNGVAQPLSDVMGRADSVFIAGNDVYAVGSEYPADETVRSILWKNGERQEFDSHTSSGFYASYSVFVSGSDVYVAGGVSTSAAGGSRAVLWKNGVRQQLSDNVSAAYSVFASGSNVYVAGYEYLGDMAANNLRAILWKDGASQQLSDNQSSAYSVRVIGGDVYVVGSDNIGGQSDGSRAVVWKNGERQQISDTWSSATSVFVK